mgnify:FL=1|tara:strand:- start:618 stop:1013 length:396 start_codon:yes stop_codon:yes gene_type:complete
MEPPPWVREAVMTFNYVHHALFASLHAALPQLVAAFVSCFVMASLIVGPCFLPLLLWASASDSRESARPADPRPTTARLRNGGLLSSDDAEDDASDRQPQPVVEWSVERVCAWLKEVELEQLSDSFEKVSK